jgi:hypothetical protein
MTSKFLTQLDLSPCPDGLTWRLDQDFLYQSAVVGQAFQPAGSGDLPIASSSGLPAKTSSSPSGVITVPAGFITDLASIPRLFWNILPPFGKYTAAAVVHDWIYRNHAYPRATCDAILLEAMQLCGVRWFPRQLIYRNVRAFGWSAWSAERPLTIDPTFISPHNPS